MIKDSIVAYDKMFSHRLAESARREIRLLQDMKPRLHNAIMRKGADRAIKLNRKLIKMYQKPTPFLSKEKKWRV